VIWIDLNGRRSAVRCRSFFRRPQAPAGDEMAAVGLMAEDPRADAAQPASGGQTETVDRRPAVGLAIARANEIAIGIETVAGRKVAGDRIGPMARRHRHGRSGCSIVSTRTRTTSSAATSSCV
jgi:hypothetical protein